MVQCWEIKPHYLWLEKPVGVPVVGETNSLTGESVGGVHGILECIQAHAPGNQCQGSTSKGAIHLWVAGEVTESWARAKQVALFPLGPLLHIQCHNPATRRLPCLGKYLRLHPLQHNGCIKTKKYDPNERTDQNSRKRTK